MNPGRFFSVVVVVVVGAGVGCDVRPSLAEIGWFEGYRADLVAQCCDCLAVRGTGHPEATCTEAVFVNGEISVADGAVFGSGDQTLDDNDSVDDGEIPCLCVGDARTCSNVLSNGAGVTVPGACLDQVDRTAPCETACAGIINFNPVPVQ